MATEGIQFIIGKLKGENTTTVASVLFDKEVWTKRKARTWLGGHGFKSGKIDETDTRLRFRQKDPDEFEKGSFRTISAGRGKFEEEQNTSLLFDVEFVNIDEEFCTELDEVLNLMLSEQLVSHENDKFIMKKHGDISPDQNDDMDKKKKKKKKDEEEMTTDLHTIENVEIFRAGTWNGDKYTIKDLDDIVEAFDSVGFKPPVKLGHAEKSGDPAYGWVNSIRRVGDKLVADFIDVPKAIFEAIRQPDF